MTTEETLDPSNPTAPVAPPDDSDSDPSEPPETVESLKEKLAAAETEAKRWKGRTEKATKKDAVSEDDMNWAINNNPRVSLVKEAYEKELKDLEDLGAKITNATKSKALESAERITGIQKSSVEVTDHSFPAPSVDRSGSKGPRMTESDRMLKVKPETIEKYRDIVEG